MAEKTLTEIVAHYRAKSLEYATKANDLEREFGGGIVLKPAQPFVRGIPVSINDIVSYLKKVGAKRPADIAKTVGSTKEGVISELDGNPDIFVKLDRGWYRLKEDAPA